VGSVLSSLHYLGTLVNDPGVHGYIEKLEPPVWVGLALAILGAMTLASMEHKEE